MNQARACRNVTMAKIKITPAATPTPAPRASELALSRTSALASSISSRTRSDAFSETSATMSPRLLSAASAGRVPSSFIIGRSS